MAGLIILDRDGVLNAMVIDSEHGTIDSPLAESQVEILPHVAESLERLSDAGYLLAIATNQPAAAKGKTTLENLKKVHSKILTEIQNKGAVIAGSYLCFHRKEDLCECRKPLPTLLNDAKRAHLPQAHDSQSVWMVGDGVTDVEAGVKAGAKTAFLGPQKCYSCKIMKTRKIEPDFWGEDLKSFVEHLLKV